MADAPAGTSRAKGLLLLFSIFVVGMVCGGALFFMGLHAADHFGHGRPGPGGPPPHDAIGHLAELLDLDDDQIEKAHEILERNRREMHEALAKTHEELLTLLDEEQSERFKTLHPRHYRGRGMGRHPRGPRHHGPPPPPPPPDEPGS